MSRRGVVRCVIAAVLFGISAPAASRLAADMSAFTLAGLLYLGAATGVLPVLGRTPPHRDSLRSGGPRLAIAVVLGGAVGPVLLASGLQRSSAASASLLLNLELAFTTVLAYVVFREHLGRRVVIGTVLVIVAGVTLTWSPDADLRVGALLIAGACLCWGVDNCVTANLDELHPAHITFAKGAIAGGANLAIGLSLQSSPPAGQILLALLVGVVGYGISITLWVAGARDLGAARAQLVFAIAPFVGAIVAWTIFSEQATLREGMAMLVAAAGVTCVLGSHHSHEHHHHPVEHEHEHRHDDGHHDHDHLPPVAVGVTHHHRHSHGQLIHAHPHVPDLHHRHDHGPT